MGMRGMNPLQSTLGNIRRPMAQPRMGGMGRGGGMGGMRPPGMGMGGGRMPPWSQMLGGGMGGGGMPRQQMPPWSQMLGQQGQGPTVSINFPLGNMGGQGGGGMGRGPGRGMGGGMGMRPGMGGGMPGGGMPTPQNPLLGGPAGPSRSMGGLPGQFQL